MQSKGFLLFLAILLGIAIAQNPDPAPDPAFTTPDYSKPGPLHMPNNNGPMFRSGWDNNCPERNRAQKAFLTMETMAKLSSTYLDNFNRKLNDGSMFTRYFSKDSSVAVEAILLATFFNVRRVGRVLLPPQDPSAPRWNTKMNMITVRYGPFPLGTEDGVFDEACRADPAEEGQTFQSTSLTDLVIMMICPYAFKWPDLPIGDNAADKPECAIFATNPYMTDAQQTLSTIFFHEFLHPNILHDPTNVPELSANWILDYDKANDPGASADYPPDGYATWNAMMLQRASSNDPDPSRRNIPLYNADSYVMFTM